MWAAAVVLLLGIAGLGAALAAVWAKEKETKAALKTAMMQRHIAEVHTDTALKALDRIYLKLIGQHPEERWALGEAERRHLSAEDEKLLKEVLGFYEQFAADSIDYPDFRFQVAKAYRRVQEIKWALGVDGWRDAQEMAIATLRDLAREFPTNRAYRNELANALNKAAELEQPTVTKVEQLEEAIALLERLSTEDPKNNRIALSASYMRMAEGMEARGRTAEADAAWRKAFEAAELLIRDFPAIPAGREQLARCFVERSAALTDRWQRLRNPTSSPGLLDEAAEGYRKSLALWEQLAKEHPDAAWYGFWMAPCWDSLGRFAHERNDYEEALRCCAKSVEVTQRLIKERPGSPTEQRRLAYAYANMTHTFWESGRLPEAEQSARRSVEAAEKLGVGLPAPATYHHVLRGSLVLLGQVVAARGRLADARAVLERAVEHQGKVVAAQPDNATERLCLGKTCRTLADALADQGKLAEAATAFRKAIELKPDDAHAYLNLGLALDAQAKPTEAEAAYRKAIELKPDDVKAYRNLGIFLRGQGKWAEAAAACRKIVESDPKLVRLDAKLAQVQAGSAQPADAAERLELARLCARYKMLTAAAARFFEQAFAGQPALQQHRYEAACAAALAGCGRGNDAADLRDEERARLRRQALAWLRAGLQAEGQQLDKDPDQARPRLAQTMRHWQRDPDFAGVRGPEALARLPATERQEWQSLWEDVAALLRRADAAQAPPDPQPGRERARGPDH